MYKKAPLNPAPLPDNIDDYFDVADKVQTKSFVSRVLQPNAKNHPDSVFEVTSAIFSSFSSFIILEIE